MTRILVFGTFDIVHDGHRDFFRQARALAPDPYLIVSVARDRIVEKIKGKPPRNSEEERIEMVRKEDSVGAVVLGAESDYISHIAELAPAIIALGYDQRGEYVEGLEKKLHDAGLSPKIIRLQPFKPGEFKTSRLAS
ncbi:MAG: FAD synthase [Parcubacteria group bacterium GW2011_GWA2_51_10]|nr:MAG: FAD synthase [Parcubacteria group bacterium GW2011_GWA2_51_10]